MLLMAFWGSLEPVLNVDILGRDLRTAVSLAGELACPTCRQSQKILSSEARSLAISIFGMQAMSDVVLEVEAV